MERKFKGKTVLITGGSCGQGAAEVRMFAAAGAQVVIGDVQDAEGNDLAASIRKAGGTAEYCHLDVTSEPDWKEAVALAMTKFGSLHVRNNPAAAPCAISRAQPGPVF